MIELLLDTCLYIGWLNQGRYESLVVGPGVVHHHSGRSCSGSSGRVPRPARLVPGHVAAARLVAPTAAVFGEAGLVLRALRMAGREAIRPLRDLRRQIAPAP